jgi:hypothetical protein
MLALMTNPAQAKIMFPFFFGATAVFALLFLVRSTVGDDPFNIMLALCAGVAAILASLIWFNVLKKKL